MEVDSGQIKKEEQHISKIALKKEKSWKSKDTLTRKKQYFKTSLFHHF